MNNNGKNNNQNKFIVYTYLKDKRVFIEKFNDLQNALNYAEFIKQNGIVEEINNIVENKHKLVLLPASQILYIEVDTLSVKVKIDQMPADREIVSADNKSPLYKLGKLPNSLLIPINN